MKTFKNISSLLNAINTGETLKSLSFDEFDKLGYNNECVDINAAEFDISIRYQEQIVIIPEKKRGNLGAYAGKKCSVICSTISRSGARINFYIKAIK